MWAFLLRRWIWKVLLEMAAIEVSIAFADTYPEARRRTLRRINRGQ